MYIVEVHEYDVLTGNDYVDYEYEDRDTAEAAFEAQRTKDFDYGDHYRETKLFERN